MVEGWLAGAGAGVGGGEMVGMRWWERDGFFLPLRGLH